MKYLAKVKLKISKSMWCWWMAGVWVVSPALSALAILPHPDPMQVEHALKKGKDFAQQHRPPNELYWHFGSNKKFEPHGFLVTKISGLAVMSSHYALRGQQPTDQDIQRVVAEDDLQIVVKIFGHSPAFARSSYLLIKQGKQVIKPERIRFDAQARTVGQDRKGPVYGAKIVGLFPYGSFEPESRAIVLVFPGAGGEIRFDIDLSTIP
ncbi:MAG: hypothetical protein WD032_02085 [Nitrospirales bacterium]